MVSAVGRLLVSVTVCTDASPMTAGTKFRLVGETRTVPSPVPESGTVCGLFGALSVKVSDAAAAAPAAVGLKET